MSEDKTSLGSADIHQILKLLPHRYPFLLVDRIIDINEDDGGIGIKNVTANEPHFTGHFPENPIMPGVLIVEAMAQTAGAICARKSTSDKNLVFHDHRQLPLPQAGCSGRPAGTARGQAEAARQHLEIPLRGQGRWRAGGGSRHRCHDGGREQSMSLISPSAVIHPLAVVEDGAVIGDDVRIGPFCHVGPRWCWVAVSSSSPMSWSPAAPISARQRASFPRPSSAGIRRASITRATRPRWLSVPVHHPQGVTMNTGTRGGGGRTVVGNDTCFSPIRMSPMIASSANNNILSNNVMLAGHVKVEDRAILGGGAAVHQFTRIGRQAFIGGLSAVAYDVIPYGMLNGNPGILGGLNVVGMTRAGIDRAVIHRVRKAYKMIFESDGAIRDNAKAAAAEFADCPEPCTSSISSPPKATGPCPRPPQPGLNRSWPAVTRTGTGWPSLPAAAFFPAWSPTPCARPATSRWLSRWPGKSEDDWSASSMSHSASATSPVSRPSSAVTVSGAPSCRARSGVVLPLPRSGRRKPHCGGSTPSCQIVIGR